MDRTGSPLTSLILTSSIFQHFDIPLHCLWAGRHVSLARIAYDIESNALICFWSPDCERTEWMKQLRAEYECTTLTRTRISRDRGQCLAQLVPIWESCDLFAAHERPTVDGRLPGKHRKFPAFRWRCRSEPFRLMMPSEMVQQLQCLRCKKGKRRTLLNVLKPEMLTIWVINVGRIASRWFDASLLCKRNNI